LRLAGNRVDYGFYDSLMSPSGELKKEGTGKDMKRQQQRKENSPDHLGVKYLRSCTFWSAWNTKNRSTDAILDAKGGGEAEGSEKTNDGFREERVVSEKGWGGNGREWLVERNPPG